MTIESIPPPKGTSGRVDCGLSGSPGRRLGGGSGRRAGVATAGVARPAVDAQVGEVQLVAVGEFTEPVEVEAAEELALHGGGADLTQVDPCGCGGLVVGDAYEQEHQPGRGVDGLGGRCGPAVDTRIPLLETPLVQRVSAGEQAGRGIEPVPVVAEGVPAPRAGRAQQASAPQRS